jgi:hypothetical protein
LTAGPRNVCHYEHFITYLHVFSSYGIPCGIHIPTTWEIHKTYILQDVAAAADFDMFDQWPESRIDCGNMILL